MNFALLRLQILSIEIGINFVINLNEKELILIMHLHHINSMINATYPTASHSPVGQYPSEKICDAKSCCWS